MLSLFAGVARSRAPVYAIALLVLIGFALRAYDLDRLPNGLHPDEAKNGVQTHALLKSGTVMEGQAWPLMIPYLDGIAVEPLYVYASIPLLAVLDLDVGSTRLLAALAGALTILGVFLLGRELFDPATGFVAAGLTLASPWLFPFGRIAFGATLLPPTIVFGLWALVKALRDGRWILPAALLFALPLYTYAVAKAVVPLLFLCALWFFRRELAERWRESPRRVLAGLTLGALIALPMYAVLIGDGGLRPWNISVWNPGNEKVTAPAPLHMLGSGLGMLHPGFLFFYGDANPRHNVPGFGQALQLALPFCIVSLTLMLRTGSRSLRLAFAALLIGLLPSALTEDGTNPHALRSLAGAPFLDLFTAAGIVACARGIGGASTRRLRLAGLVLGCGFALNSLFYFQAYFGRYRVESQPAFTYGALAAVRAALERRDEFDLALVTPLLHHARLYALFLERTDPRELRSLDYRPYVYQFEAGTAPPEVRRVLVIQKHAELGVPPFETVRGADGRAYFTLGRVKAGP